MLSPLDFGSLTLTLVDIQSYIKELAPNKLVVDGTYGVNTTHLSIPAIDIFSDHFYPPDIAKLEKDISLVQSVNKVYIAGEYDWTGNVPSAASLLEFFSSIEASPVVGGDLFWSLFMHDVRQLRCQPLTCIYLCL
jgi:mannan endo-1,4-beta-mannosidase